MKKPPAEERPTQREFDRNSALIAFRDLSPMRPKGSQAAGLTRGCDP